RRRAGPLRATTEARGPRELRDERGPLARQPRVAPGVPVALRLLEAEVEVRDPRLVLAPRAWIDHVVRAGLGQGRRGLVAREREDVDLLVRALDQAREQLHAARVANPD